MLESLKNRFFNKSLENQLLSARAIGKETNIGFDYAKTVGILFDTTDILNYGTVLKFADKYKKMGKKVKLLGYIDSSTPNHALAFDFFSKKNTNWYNKPVSPVVDAFIEKDFDILVNAYMEDKLPLIYISTLSKASLKVGLYFPEFTNASDMMITVRDEANLENFFKEINHYLNIFNYNE